MNISFPYKLAIRFPGDLDYIPSIRKFVSEALQVSNFNTKFAYRSEIIVDEISNNAVNYGCKNENAFVDLECFIYEDKIEFTIKDQGGDKNDLDKLKTAIKSELQKDEVEKKGLGREIVKMLSESMDIKIDDQNLTSIHIVRKREEPTN
jgi:anti-sigma regulatory factor (Ser/Thr protein kinase)